jgi:RNA polymerase sigma-70 factor (ECF subfamily)
VRAQYEAVDGPGPVPGDFAGVYEQHFAGIHRYIAGRLGRDVADDIAADTFVIALRKQGSFDAGRGPVRGWLYGIATNLVAQHRPRRGAGTGRLRASGQRGWPTATRTAWCPGWPRKK